MAKPGSWLKYCDEAKINDVLAKLLEVVLPIEKEQQRHQSTETTQYPNVVAAYNCFDFLHR